jgi:hypothetical protein
MLHAARVSNENADVMGARVGLKTWQTSLSRDKRRRRLFIARDGGREEGGEGGGDARCSSHENLHAMVAVVGQDNAAVAVDGDAAERVVESPVG